MRLWTIQPYCVYELLQKDGIYRCNSDLSPLLDDSLFINAYEWISKQMKKIIGNPPVLTKYPVWAWYLIESENKRPDMRKCGFKVFEKSVLLEIEIPDDSVLLTDFNNWHIILNDGIKYKANSEYLSYEEWELESQKEDEYYDSLSNEEKISYKEKSWETIICSEDTHLAEYVQATFWELKKSQIKKVWFLKK